MFLKRGSEGESEREKHQCVLTCGTLPTGELAHNPGTCLNWELNCRSFGSQSGTQSTELHQPGHVSESFNMLPIFAWDVLPEEVHPILNISKPILNVFSSVQPSREPCFPYRVDPPPSLNHNYLFLCVFLPVLRIPQGHEFSDLSLYTRLLAQSLRWNRNSVTVWRRVLRAMQCEKLLKVVNSLILEMSQQAG